MHFIFINDKGRFGKPCPKVNNFSQLIELIFSHWGTEDVILMFKAALDLPDEIALFKPDFLFLLNNFDISLVFVGYSMRIPHFFLKI